jgi:very-short-patch-repair endonuclease
MRHEPTDAERVLWQYLRHLSIDGSHFRRQATIGRYLADFACHRARLVIEIDGGRHNEVLGYRSRCKADCGVGIARLPRVAVLEQ